MDNQIESSSSFLFYSGKDGKKHVQVILGDETIMTTQRGMSEIFNVDVRTINEHLQNIYNTNELQRGSTIRKNRIVQKEGNRDVSREVEFYNLDVIIAVGYRVNSYEATQFRIWATRVIKEYLVKGFVLDDERLKQGNKLFGKDYFKELLDRIREIRASEKMFYEKITDLYATSVDYDSHSPETHRFFAKVQNKLEFAIVGMTSAEIIKSRADASMPKMGLKTWKNSAKDGRIMKSDTTIAKNYLEENEIRQLNVLVNMYLDYAELTISRNKLMTMKDWADRLDLFLKFNEYDVLDGNGKIRKDVADTFAEKEYSKYKITQDKEYKSDFNRFVENVTSNKLSNEDDFIDYDETISEDEKQFIEYIESQTPIETIHTEIQYAPPQDPTDLPFNDVPDKPPKKTPLSESLNENLDTIFKTGLPKLPKPPTKKG